RCVWSRHSRGFAGGTAERKRSNRGSCPRLRSVNAYRHRRTGESTKRNRCIDRCVHRACSLGERELNREEWKLFHCFEAGLPRWARLGFAEESLAHAGLGAAGLLVPVMEAGLPVPDGPADLRFLGRLTEGLKVMGSRGAVGRAEATKLANMDGPAV